MTPNPSSGSPFRRALFAIAARLLPPVRHLQATNASLGAQVTRAQQERDETARRARMYEALFEQTQDAVAVFDLDGICILANQRCSELLGYTQSELIGVRYGSVSEDTAAARELFARLVAGETIPRYQRTLRHKDGHLLYTETSSTLVRDAEGNPTCVQAVIRDISEQRRAQIELANHSQLLQTLIDNLPDFVYVKDRECRFVITNIAHAKSMGRRPEDIIGKSDM